MNDTELMALTCTVNALTDMRAATNTDAEREGRPPEYTDRHPFPELDALHTELQRRRRIEGKADESPEPPVAEGPSETEEPEQDPAPTMTLAQAREFARATSFAGDPRVGLARYRHAAAILDLELEASAILVRAIRSQAVAPQGVLPWQQPAGQVITARSARPEAAHYCVRGSGFKRTWFASLGDVQVRSGTIYECMDACEELERNPVSPPPSGKGTSE